MTEAAGARHLIYSDTGQVPPHGRGVGPQDERH